MTSDGDHMAARMKRARLRRGKPLEQAMRGPIRVHVKKGCDA